MKRVALVVAIALAAPHVYAKPESRSEARTRYEAAQKAYAAGRYDDAARDFSRAYELVGDSGLLYNAAQAFRLAGNWAMAADLYRTLLDKLPPKASNRPEIEGRIAEMDERVADEKRRADRAREEAEEKQRQAAAPVEPPPVATPPVEHAPPPRPGRTLEIVGYSLSGVAGALLGTGIAMSVLSHQANDAVESAARHNAIFTPGLKDDQSNGHVYDKVQIASYAIAGAAAVGASVALVLGMRADKRAQERVTVRPGIGPGAFVLAGQF